MFDLYQQQILDRFKHPQHTGILKDATHRGDGANYSCGDEIHWDITVKNDQLTELKHTTRACAICTASADLLVEEVQGKSLAEVTKITPEKITETLGIPLSPTRLKCALLPLEALKEALK